MANSMTSYVICVEGRRRLYFLHLVLTEQGQEILVQSFFFCCGVRAGMPELNGMIMPKLQLANKSPFLVSMTEKMLRLLGAF